MESPVEYKVKTASVADVHSHLSGCKDNFVPALDKTVNISDYSEKIVENSITFEAWVSGKLVGLVAAYFNDRKNKKGFITNVSTSSDLLGKGIGSRLIKNCVEYAKMHDFNEIGLEVNANNENAIKLYEKYNFVIIDSDNENISMKCTLK